MNDDQYYEIFKVKGTIALKSKKEFVAMIPRIYRSGIYKKKGFGSIFECAAKLGGVSHAVVEEAIRIDEKLADLPKLRQLMPKVGVSKLKRIVSVAKKETENEWAKKVQKMSKAALETHIRDIKKSVPGHSEKPKSLFGNNFESFIVKLDPKVILRLKIIKQKMGDGTTWNDVFEKLTDLPKPKSQKNPKPTNPETRQASTKQRREALESTDGKCNVTGCNKPAEEIHHEKPWSIFRSHQNLKPLCKAHHELAHQSNSIVDQKFRKYKMQVATQP